MTNSSSEMTNGWTEIVRKLTENHGFVLQVLEEHLLKEILVNLALFVLFFLIAALFRAVGLASRRIGLFVKK